MDAEKLKKVTNAFKYFNVGGRSGGKALFGQHIWY